MTHVSFTDIVNRIAESAWGRDFKSSDDPSKELCNDLPRLTAFALVELLKRLNAIAAAAGESSNRRRENPPEKVPDYAKAFPDKEVGDSLFSGDLDDGFAEYLIVAKDESHLCLIVLCGNDVRMKYPPPVHFACNWHYTTLKEAMIECARSDLSYHQKKVDFAKNVLHAIETDGDLRQFWNGWSEEE